MLILIAFVGLQFQTVSGQSINDSLYERSLLDSAILYERIKPVHAKLKIAYEANREYSFYLTKRMQEQMLQAELREKEILREHASFRRGARRAAKRSIVFGFATGVLVGLLIK